MNVQQEDRFSGIVDQYDLWSSIDPDYGRIHGHLRRLLLRTLRSIPGPVVDILEIGSGTGHTSKIVLDADPRIHLTMVEQSPGMIQRSMEVVAPYPGRWRLWAGDMLQVLPMSSDQFPVVISAQTIHNLHPDYQERAYRMIFEKLLSGGVLLSGDKVSLDDEVAYQRTLEVVNERIRAVQGSHPEACEFFLNHEVEDDRIRVTESDLKKMLVRVGFSDVRISCRCGMHAIITAGK